MSNNTKRYKVFGNVVGGKYLGEVEAVSEEEAEEKAWKELSPYVSLCHQCASECENAEIETIELELV